MQSQRNMPLLPFGARELDSVRLVQQCWSHSNMDAFVHRFGVFTFHFPKQFAPAYVHPSLGFEDGWYHEELCSE